MITYILIATSTLLLITTSIYFFKYIKIKKNVKEYEEIGTGRYGFYDSNKNCYDSAIVYVKELDRYTDGFSRIVIDKVEPYNKSYNNESTKKAYKNFMTLKRTGLIDWLESEDKTRQIRKEKLKNINKL